MNSKVLSSQPLKASHKRIGVALVGLSFIGFADAAYLTILRYLGQVPPCSLTSGCETVLTSKYAVVGEIPVSVFGSFFYLAVFFTAIAALSFESESLLRVAAILAGVGFMASLGLFYLQAFIIKAFCFYCLVSAGVSFLLFLTGGYFVLSSIRIKIKA